MRRNKANDLKHDVIKFPRYSYIEGFIPEEDFQKLTDGLSEKSKQDGALPIHKIAYAMFSLVSLTGLRTSSILALRLSDISDMKAMGRGGYSITVVTKTRPYGVTYVISQMVYNVVQKVIEYTAEYRENVPQNVREMLFITPKGKVTAEAVNRIIKDVCREVGIKDYTMRNVRKTYMAYVVQFSNNILTVGSSTRSQWDYYVEPSDDDKASLMRAYSIYNSIVTEQN